jgi:hypothetical protein
LRYLKVPRLKPRYRSAFAAHPGAFASSRPRSPHHPHPAQLRIPKGENVKRLLLASMLMLAVGAAWAMPGMAPAAAAAAPVKGEVLEVKDTEMYTYLRLKTADGETWAAVGKSTVAKGAQVTIENPQVMTNFPSKSLNRTFDKIVFGSLAGAGAPAGGSAAAMPPGKPQAADAGNVKVAKATGPDAKTVAEIVGGRAALKDKSVVVRGKVVKFTAGVMGKNWVHLRDGTGSAADKTNDVLVTTKDETKVGDVVVARGIVRTDVDLGSGYAYKVLVEEAKLQK